MMTLYKNAIGATKVSGGIEFNVLLKKYYWLNATGMGSLAGAGRAATPSCFPFAL